ncbi:MAG: TIGR04283 family arsenosugar biosynthesis glycosyltransferase [Pseudomonadota bacterium]|nr:TIGR04283 family arsenosugar biosynthesis glycosyltransferase [Pseudomonadota bacterium]
MQLSVIIPVLNEADRIVASARALAPLRARGHEVICVDGGSSDGTATLCEAHSDLVIGSGKGRARQMNAGAARASGEVLLFLHADTALPERVDELVIDACRDQPPRWGCFDVTLSGDRFAFRVIESTMNLRTRISGVVTGDKAMFVDRTLFETVGGYPDLPLMEDVAISRRLKRLASPVFLHDRVVASSRYWERRGIARSVIRMWALRLRYFLGTDPARLERAYYDESP